MRRATIAASVAFAFSDVPTVEDDWLSFPSRHGAVLIHKDCVHRFDDNSHTGGDMHSHGQEALGPCPHAPRYPRVTHQNVVAENLTTSRELASYYSDWVAYTVMTGDFGYMSTDWVVPPAPTTHGPVPGMSSTYLFNGLEDGGGVHGKSTYILQPVLSYGKSGCIINPANFFQWYLISFSVTGAGRALCGKRIAVSEGEKVRGIMQLEDDGTSWSTISIRLKNNDTSVAKTDLAGKQPDAAYITLETMVNYACSSFPKGGTITFDRSVLKDRRGDSIKADWKTVIRHKECNQQVRINSDDSVTLTWDDTSSKFISV
jgi:hypothetical protein